MNSGVNRAEGGRRLQAEEGLQAARKEKNVWKTSKIPRRRTTISGMLRVSVRVSITEGGEGGGGV